MYKYEKNGNNILERIDVKMETNNLKNTVILKSVPSNIVDEAIFVLKKNIKIKEAELQNQRETIGKEVTEKTDNYIVKEAEMIINDYCNKVENVQKRDKVIKSMQRRYNKIKKLLIGTTIVAIIEMIVVILK